MVFSHGNSKNIKFIIIPEIGKIYEYEDDYASYDVWGLKKIIVYYDNLKKYSIFFKRK